MARRLLPEWAPQSGVMLSWPDPDTDWGPRLHEVEPVFLSIARAISRFEPLLICVHPGRETHLRQLLNQAGLAQAPIRLFTVDYDDTWTRDYGPVSVSEQGRPLLLDFRFNGWGGKYPAARDDKVNRHLHAAGLFGDTPLLSLPLILEGGSIDGDGEGSLLTTRYCLRHPGRNPGLDQARLDAELKQHLGVERIFWLEHGKLEGDDTDGHIDTLARFCDPSTIAYQHCDDPQDSHYAELQAMAQELARLRRANGRPYRLIPLPWPAPCYDSHGRRLPASYANFLILNGAVLVPGYRSPASDRLAAERLGACFPGREVIAIDCLPLIEQNGSLHCLTMQFAAGVYSP